MVWSLGIRLKDAPVPLNDALNRIFGALQRLGPFYYNLRYENSPLALGHTLIQKRNQLQLQQNYTAQI